LSQDGWETPVEGIADSGRIETVYNLEVEEDHTYFVGCAEWGWSVWSHNKCHGNSLASPKVTTLYQLVNSSGAVLKWGISSNPGRRYSPTFLASIHATLVPIMTGTRRSMAQIERSAVSQRPGLLNFESWANSMWRR
jgi:hypothetical protein